MPRFPGVDRLALLLPAMLAMTACGGNDGGGPDTRCFGVAQVPAWLVTIDVAFNNTGGADSFLVRLHQTGSVTGLTDSALPATVENGGPNARLWLGGVPTGTLSHHDTVINANSHDTIAANSTSFVPPGSDGGLPGVYVAASLENCSVAVGAHLQGLDSVTGAGPSGAFSEVDTTLVGYPFFPGNAFDSLAGVIGYATPSHKVRSVLANLAFGTTSEYRIAGFAGPYVHSSGGGAGVVFDSATVSWSAVPQPPAGSPAGGALPFGGMMLRNGAIVVRTPR